MRVLPNLRAAGEAVRGNRRRSLLSSLGVAVATLAIVLLTAIALGVRRDFAEQIEDLGVGVLIVLPGRLDAGAGFNLGGASYLKADDADRLRRLSGVKAVATFTFVGGGATYRGKAAPGFLIAASPAWFTMRRWEIAEGRLLTAADDGRRVAVIGGTAKTAILPAGSAVGKRLRINGREFEIVGVTRDRKSEDTLAAIGSLQNAIYLPYATQRKLEPQSQTDRIFVQSETGTEPKRLISAIEGELGRSLDRSQFSVVTQEDLLRLVFRFMSVLTWLVSGLASIALVIGGLGIMTVMLLSVGERTAEIGVRVAFGARRSDIFMQFFAESVILASTGSLGGILFGAGAAIAIARWTPIRPLVTPELGLGALAAGLVAGALFGILPARRAARLDPAAAIRTA